MSLSGKEPDQASGLLTNSKYRLLIWALVANVEETTLIWKTKYWFIFLFAMCKAQVCILKKTALSWDISITLAYYS